MIIKGVCDRKGLKHKSLWWYACKRTSFWLVVSVVLAFVLWIIAEVVVRDAMPAKHFPKLNHLLNIFDVIMGAIVTSFIFYWTVEHYPRMRREYPRRIDLEYKVFFILANFRDFKMKMLYGQPRMFEEGNIYLPWTEYLFPNQPPIGELMVMQRPEAKVVEYEEEVDPFAKHYEMDLEFIQGIANEILDMGIDVPEEFRFALPWKGKRLPEPEGSIESWRAFIRIDCIDDIHYKIAPFYRYLKRMVFDHTNVIPEMDELYQRITYRSLWDDVDEHKRFKIELRKRFPIHWIENSDSSEPEAEPYGPDSVA